MNKISRLAKLTRPSPAAAYARTRLFELLDQRRASAPVVWITGPPGSGKTTLVADYLGRRGLDCLWYQVDRGDADIASFFHYLSEAVQQRAGAVELPQFHLEVLGDVEAFARRYFRETYQRLSAPLLVFDNFQEVMDDALLAVLPQALIELPPDGGMIILSRNDPPSRFATLRASGRLELIGWNELRLTSAECRGIAEVRGAKLGEEALEQLYTRTQGWAAGVVLMLQDMRASSHQINDASRTMPSVIFDYLAEEILQKQPPAVRESLLRLAYLPQITATMACNLDVDEASRVFLADLARKEFLATVMHVEPEPISQLHPLLREFLLARAEQTGSADEIHQRKQLAARVLADQQHIEAAAALLIRIGEWQRLADLIVAHAGALLRQGRHQLLEGWIRALPEATRLEEPRLLHWLAACRFPYAPSEARDLFALAYKRFETQVPLNMTAVLGALNGVIESIMREADNYTLLDPWIDAANRWTRDLTEWPAPDLEARVTCTIFLAVALRRPNHPHLHEWRARTQAIAQSLTDLDTRIAVDSTLILLSAWNGQFAAGERVLQGLHEKLKSPGISAVYATEVAQAEAIYYMLRGDRARCIKAVDRGLGVAENSGVRLWNDTFLPNALWAVLADGDLDAAASYLARINSRSSGARRYDLFLRAYGEGWYAMLRGDTFLAHQHLKTAARAASEVGLPAFQSLASLALSHLLMDAADLRGAERELTRAGELTASMNNRFFEFMNLMCRARYAALGGQLAASNEALRAGLAIARERDLVFHPWWQPRAMAQLMQQALAEGIEEDFVRRLIQVRHLLPDPPPYLQANWPWRYRLRALGTFEFETSFPDAAARTRRTGRPMELLKALVAFGGRDVSLEQLADALWPRIDSDYAHRSLTTTLHRLRKILGDDAALIVSDGALSLNRHLFWIDCWAFDQQTAACMSLISAGADPEAIGTAAQRALAYYRGPLLAADLDAPWAVAPREQRRNQLLRVVTGCAQALEKEGAIERSLELYRHALECEPHAEALHRRLMIGLKEAGRRAEAIEAYHACKATLQAHLGVMPSPATMDIYQSLMTA